MSKLILKKPNPNLQNLQLSLQQGTRANKTKKKIPAANQIQVLTLMTMPRRKLKQPQLLEIEKLSWLRKDKMRKLLKKSAKKTQKKC